MDSLTFPNLVLQAQKSITGYSKEIWSGVLTNREKRRFFAHLLLKTINSCKMGCYTDFDAHTSSNCCHGIAVFVRDMLAALDKFDLDGLENKVRQNLFLQNSTPNHSFDCLEWTPGPLVDLASLYALTLASVMDPEKGRRTDNLRIRSVSHISNSFCETIGRALQKFFANLIAERYGLYVDILDENMEISDAPVQLWGKYVQGDYIRGDKRHRKYVSSMFSMQVSLAYLIHTSSKVALVNDLISYTGNVQGRFVQVFQGNDTDNFIPLEPEELDEYNLNEPLVIYGACAINESLDLNTLSLRMRPWLYQLPRLVQAHEIHYPQFPRVGFDPGFDSTPIYPAEEKLRGVIRSLSKIKGVDCRDPSFCCFTHIFPASIGQVMKVLDRSDESALPYSHKYLPSEVLSKKCKH